MMPSTSLHASPTVNGIQCRLRSDIVWQQAGSDPLGMASWIAINPLTRSLFRCGVHEYQLLKWLSQCSDLPSLQAKFEEEFAPRTIAIEQIQMLIARAAQSGLLRSTAPVAIPTLQSPKRAATYSTRSTNRYSKSNSLRGLGGLGKLATALLRATQWQCSLGSPDRWSGWLAKHTNWLYSGAATCLWLILFAVCTCLIGLRFDSFWSELPSLQILQSPLAMVGFSTVFVLTRVLHEAGHAVVCNRHGLRCTDAGLLMSFGMMVPYVDITESQRLANRRSRMAIALAGMYTECVLGSLMAIVWLSTHPGWLHDIAFKTLLVCTVTTLLFNANPLLKYDGYWVLSDAIGIQNLRERSFEVMDQWLDGRRKQSWLSTLLGTSYFLASSVNRLLLTMGIVTLWYTLACTHRIAGIGLTLIGLYIGCLALANVHTGMLKPKHSHSPGLRRQTAWLGWIAVSMLVAWMIHLPLPSRVFTAGTFLRGQRQAIYSSVSGSIQATNTTNPQQATSVGTELLGLSNERIVQKLNELEMQWVQINKRIETISRQAYYRPESESVLPALQNQKALLHKQREQLRNEQARLSICANEAGTFEPAVATPLEPIADPNELAMGFGNHGQTNLANDTWLSDRTVGRFVKRGTLIGWLRLDDRASVECLLSEDQVAGVSVGTEAKIRLIQHPGQVFSGKVVELAKRTQVAEDTPNSVISPDRLVAVEYRVRIELQGSHEWDQHRTGNAEVVLIRPSQSLFERVSEEWARHAKLR